MSRERNSDIFIGLNHTITMTIKFQLKIQNLVSCVRTPPLMAYNFYQQFIVKQRQMHNRSDRIMEFYCSRNNYISTKMERSNFSTATFRRVQQQLTSLRQTDKRSPGVFVLIVREYHKYHDPGSLFQFLWPAITINLLEIAVSLSRRATAFD